MHTPVYYVYIADGRFSDKKDEHRKGFRQKPKHTHNSHLTKSKKRK